MNLKTIKISDIKEDFNPRNDFSKVPELVKSIEAVGLLHPLVVRKSGNEFVLVDGSQRLRALKSLGEKEVAVNIIDAENADEAQMAANLMRADLNILERARGYTRLILTMPARYNAAAVAKAFGTPAKTVTRLVGIAKKLPVTADAMLTPLLGQLGIEDLEYLVQIPAGVMDKVVKLLDENPQVDWTLRQVAHRMDFYGDFKTTAYVAAGKAFEIKVDGRTEVWTADKAVFDEARAAFEKHNKKKYGTASDEVKEKTAAEKEADKKKKAAENKSREEALKALPANLKKVISAKVSKETLNEMGQDLTARFVQPAVAKNILAAFGKKPSDNTWELSEQLWKDVFAPLCPDTDKLGALYEVFSQVAEKMGEKTFAEVVAGLAKK